MYKDRVLKEMDVHMDGLNTQIVNCRNRSLDKKGKFYKLSFKIIEYGLNPLICHILVI